jgi:PAS domain-containing protein/anti-sigma regulatory factor (Ser/Thr protein kinase)
VLLAAGLLPLAFGMVRFAGVVPWWWLDPTPFSFVVSLVLVAWGLLRYRLLEQVPVARSLVVEAIRDGVVVLDADRRVVDANPAARRLLGDGEPVVGRPAGDVFARWPRLVDGIADLEPGTFELPFDEGLESRTFEAAVSPVADGGRHPGVRGGGARRDCAVAPRAAAPDAQSGAPPRPPELGERRPRARGAAARPGVEPGGAEAVMDASRDLVELSRKASLVDASREGDRTAEVVDVADGVATEVERARREFPAATFEVDAPESALAYADPHVDAAIANLVENAVEHHDGDEPRVRVSVAETPSYVEVEVADDGPGVPEREHDVLREGVETPLEHGSGLGLWLVNWIVTRSSGDLSIESTPTGSVVRVRFRRAE